MDLNLKPLHNNVLIKPLAEETTTSFGLVLPQTIDQERPEKGEVIAVGPGKLLDNGQIAPMNVKVGDQVMFKKYSPSEFKIKDQEYLVVREDDIMLVIN